MELKAVWQNLLQRQIFQLNAGMEGSSLSSPMESPEVPINSSVGTLQSVETSSFRRQPQTLAIDCGRNSNECSVDIHDVKKQLETLIEHKCKQIGKTSFNGKCNAIHLEQWMKTQLDNVEPVSPVVEQIDEFWTEDKLRKRSEELQLIDSKGNVTSSMDSNKNGSVCEELILSDQDEPSPSKSTTTESQVTVRSSPIVPETVPVCRQCHKKCLSNILQANNQLNSNHSTNCINNQKNNNQGLSETVSTTVDEPVPEKNDWQAFLLLGICSNPVANLVKYDPFKVQLPAPEISVAPPTPENSVNSDEGPKTHICLTNGNCENSLPNRAGNVAQTSDDDSPQTEEHPYHSLSNSVQTLRRFGTLSSLEQFGSEAPDDAFENNCSSPESGDEEDDSLGLDNEGFNHTSILSWTARAGSFVAEKMAFFEKLGGDYRSGAGFFDRYLKSPDDHVNGEEAQEEETSGGTSGEEVWGTPTSGDLEDPLCSPTLEGKLSPSNGSYSSDNMDDTEFMMDELLMAPPITGAILRGLLPRRTLEPLIEEDFSDSSSSASSDPISPQSGSSDQDIRSGSAADTCSRDVADRARNGPVQVADLRRTLSSSGSGSAGTTTSPEENAHQSQATWGCDCPTTSHSLSSEWEEAQKVCEDDEECCGKAGAFQTAPPSPNMPRSESYRKIVEAAEDAILGAADNSPSRGAASPALLFQHFRPAAKFASIERVPRTKSIRIFEFFNVRRSERRIYEKFPPNLHAMKTFHEADDSDSAPSTDSPSKTPSKELKDNRNGRFWRQLSRRRTIEKTTNMA